jgi:hypothetical protein
MDINRTKPTIEEVKEWNRDKLLEWIQRKRPGLLEDDNLETFKNAFICGNVFVKHGCDVGFFRNGCNLPIGISHKLMDLVVEITGGETAGMVQKGKTQDISAGKSTDLLTFCCSLHTNPYDSGRTHDKEKEPT